VPPALAGLGADLERVEAGLGDALGELREIARGIHPPILSDGGLRPALRALARRSPVPVSLKVGHDGRLPEQVEVSAYYVVAEALTNAARHAHASAVSVHADLTGGALRITVRDGGAGGTGLAGLKDRVEALGGLIVLHSPPGPAPAWTWNSRSPPPAAAAPYSQARARMRVACGWSLPRAGRSSSCGTPSSQCDSSQPNPSSRARIGGMVPDGRPAAVQICSPYISRGRLGRWVVEQSFSLLHCFRWLRVRGEICDDIHEAFLSPARGIIYWRRLASMTLCQEF
jgi:hypothetical protein